MDPLLEAIRRELKANEDEKTRRSANHYFKEKISVYGVKTSIVKKVAKEYLKRLSLLSKAAIFELCQELLGSGFMEEAFIVSFWLPNLIERLEASDICVFKTWIEQYIDNWAKCDSFCNHTVGDLVEKFPETVSEVKNWSKLSCRWLRRASAVSLILPARGGLFLQEVFEISDTLLMDQDDLVQKGYGWLLKETSKKHTKEVFDYVTKNKKLMPRTALRYAIELMPKDLKAKAMQS